MFPEWNQIVEVILRCDGGIRQGRMALGYLAFNPNNENEIYFQGSKRCGSNGTSNVAEYRALIEGLDRCVKEQVKIVHIILDSQLVVKQVNGSFKVTNLELKKHMDKVVELLNNFQDYSIKWEPRSHNKLADRLVNNVFEGKKDAKKS
jgi:ribonuclease HI